MLQLQETLFNLMSYFPFIILLSVIPLYFSNFKKKYWIPLIGIILVIYSFIWNTNYTYSINDSFSLGSALGWVFLLILTYFTLYIISMLVKKDPISKFLSKISLEKIEGFLKFSCYIVFFLIINTIIDFVKLVKIGGDYIVFRHYIYYIAGVFGLVSYLILVNYILRTKK
jgi:hypothetical protein|tara:strand:+ start:708 stop:1217 length:510 start_codon:yes stop_codon:yes gene_type:complete